ncbi:MAG: lysylphosphatidylglycerol synthase transmembrane domain-containing protein, partial [Actinomycetota bacterium]
ACRPIGPHPQGRVDEELGDICPPVGPDRAARAACVLDPAELEASLPLMQPLALSSETRRRIRRRKEIVDEVRSALAAELDVEDVELEPLERISFGSLVTFAGFVFLLWFGVQLIAGWDEIVDELDGADWSYLPAIIAVTALTYVAGAVGLAGAVVRRLPLVPTTVVMVAQSFLNRFTPANAGGMAMRVRYLQKGGSETERAVMSIGLTSLAVPVVQVVLFLVFLLWAGSDQAPEADYSLPSVADLALLLLGVSAVIGGLLAYGRLRVIVVEWVRKTWGKIAVQFRELASRPSRMLLLFGGTAANKVLIILAFVGSCRALDIDLGFAQLGLLYLVGSTVGAAVPTPGGLGAVEAALIAVLTGAAVGTAPATAAVILFRLVTYWLPVPFGYIALRYSRSVDLV